MKKFLAATATFLTVTTILGACSANQPDSQTPPSAQPNTLPPTISTPPTTSPTAGSLTYTRTKIGSSSFAVPQPWTNAIVPGADKGYFVTTAPNNQTVGITLLANKPLPITDTLLSRVTSTLQSTNPAENVQTNVQSDTLGTISLVKENKTITSWIVATKTGTFLVTVGPAYKVTSGKSAPQPTPSAYTPGTAEEQTLAMVEKNEK